MELLERVRSVVEGFEGVRLAYVFGSVVRGSDRRGSDLDLAVLLGPKETKELLDVIVRALEAATGRTVDLVDLAQAPPLLVHEILSSGTILFARDDVERVRFVTRAVARYLDTAYLRRIQHRYLRERVEARGAPAR